ncbi:MAG: putative signal transducing protein [Gaiellales bacterium]
MKRLTWAANLTEAEMIAGLLEGEGIRVLIRRQPGMDVPDFLAGGPRELLVDDAQYHAAAELVEAHFGLR